MVSVIPETSGSPRWLQTWIVLASENGLRRNRGHYESRESQPLVFKFGIM